MDFSSRQAAISSGMPIISNPPSSAFINARRRDVAVWNALGVADQVPINAGIIAYDLGADADVISASTNADLIAGTLLAGASIRPIGRISPMGVPRTGLEPISGRLTAVPESPSPTLIPRLGPKGVDPLRHNANVLVRDAQGNVVAHQRFVSGNMTLEEQALGFPKNTLASHTEARAVRTMELQPGGSMTITGQSPPCPSCKGAMNRAASESGATIKYQWRQNGKTVSWTATPK
jgi:hypothetical protein